jgi:hypothetical protein
MSVRDNSVPIVPKAIRRIGASLPRHNINASRDSLVLPHAPLQVRPPLPPVPVLPLATRSIRPCLSSPAISRSITVPPSSTVPQPQPADLRKSRRYCTDFEFGNRYGEGHTQQLRDELRQLQPLQTLRSLSLFPSSSTRYQFPDNGDDMRSNASSAELTPLATYSDASVSSCDNEQDSELELELAFPRPPENPMILERVEDFSLFTEQETDAFRIFLRKWEASAAARRVRIKEKKSAGEKRDEGADSDFSWEAMSSLPHEAANGICDPRMSSSPEDDVSHVLRSLRNEPPEGHDGGARERILSREVQPIAVPLVFRNTTEGNHDRNDKVLTQREQRPSAVLDTSETQAEKSNKRQRYRKFTPSLPSSARVPQIIRKVASMSIKSENNTKRGQVPDLPMPVSQRLVQQPSMPALGRLEDSMSKLQQFQEQTMPHHTDHTVRAGLGGKGHVGSPVDFPRMESSGAKHPGHRPQTSLPLPSGGSAFIQPRALATPFTHRPTRSQPAAIIRNGHRSVDVTTRSESNTKELNVTVDRQRLKSFMDITPERDTKRSSGGAQKERVRRLLARASNGVIGWGKSLSKKKILGR